MTSKAWATSVTLVGDTITLTPTTADHTAGLARAAADGYLSDLWYTFVPQSSDVPQEIQRRLDLQKKRYDGSLYCDPK